MTSLVDQNTKLAEELSSNERFQQELKNCLKIKEQAYDELESAVCALRKALDDSESLVNKLKQSGNELLLEKQQSFDKVSELSKMVAHLQE